MIVDEKQRHASRPLSPGEEGPPVVTSGVSFKAVTDKIAGIALRPEVPVFWFTAFGIAMVALSVMCVAIAILLDVGVGTFGNNIPDAWVFPIANYVWWIEIAVGGSLLSSILRLCNQSWRNSINRLAEGVTLSGIVCAGLFPVIHMGRSWIFYWVLPYPDTMLIQPNFRSPLVWDVFGIFTYATASVLFWYLDMIPDLATLRDRAESRKAYMAYAILALGWRGSSKEWARQEKASILLAGILTPLVFTVHTVVSFDFAISLLPGWHATIFPPYFVDGAIEAGIAMVTLMTVSLRSHFGLREVITERHLNNLAKVILTTAIILAYIYCFEPFTAWYSGDQFEMFTVHNRGFGNYAWTFWSFVLLGLIIPQALWWKSNRTNPKRLFVIALLIVIGMWEERYMLMVTSLSKDFMPSAWANFSASAEDNALLYGSIGLFVTCFMFLMRTLPMLSIAEIKELLPYSKPGGGSVK